MDAKIQEQLTKIEVDIAESKAVNVGVFMMGAMSIIARILLSDTTAFVIVILFISVPSFIKFAYMCWDEYNG